MPDASTIEDEEERFPHHRPFYNPFNSKPILINPQSANHIVLALPIASTLLIPNAVSEVRDLAANERTFLSYLRLSIYLAVVAVAIILSFHFDSRPSQIERKVALPLGIIFWVLAVTCFGNGVLRYASVIEGYGKRKALVQSGRITQVLLAILAVIIVGTCVFFVSVGARAQ